jgi:Tol biopolymer transport system component
VNVTPADTVLLPGAHLQLRARAVDAFGNDRSDAEPRYEAGSSNITVGQSGTVEATAAGRAFVIVSAGNAADTAWVSVVPAGAFVAYTNGLPGGALGVITMNNDGSGYKLLANLSTYNFGDGAGPAFSPDHGKVIFFNDQGVGDGTRLYVADVASGAVTRATAKEDNPIVREEWGRYSADGQWIYFSGARSGKNFSLWRVKPDGSSLGELGGGVGAGGNNIEWRGDPSPDGTKLAFVGDGVTIQVMDIATGTIDPNIHVPGQTPRWSPDGTHIAYVRGGYIDGNAIYVMNADGTGNRLVSRTDRSYWEELDWTADGKWLLIRGSQELEFVSVDDGESLPLDFTRTFYHPATMR